MSWIPHITVAAIIERGQKFLLVKEIVQGLEVYNQPAGHLEERESLIDAVKRETFEETGMQFEPQFITGIYHYREPNSRETYLRIAFGGSVIARSKSAILDKGIIETKWLESSVIHGLSVTQMRSPMVLKCIKDYMNNVRYPLHLLTYINCCE